MACLVSRLGRVERRVIPEMYVAEDCRLFHGELGDPTGAMPMVGYGAGAYVLHVLQRERVESTNRDLYSGELPR